VTATIGELLRERLSLEDMQAGAQIFERALRDGEARGDLSVRAADARLRVLDCLMKRVDRKPEMLVAIISRDVTERRDLERRLQASERLEALGRLAGSVAHDFNNLLTVIGGSAELALDGLEPTHPARADMDAVLAAARTATHLARQLLTFSRHQLVVRARVDIGAVLRAQREVLARLVGPCIRLEYELEEPLPPVFVPQAQIEQIALNLASNARDAMPGGGRLRITARRRTLADRDVGDLVAGTYVELAVSDEGTGIPRDVLPHLFEPFYSTKRGLGTGLGLATCHGIAVQAGGAIQVDTRPGRGTTFRVCFPIADSRAQAPAVSSAASEPEHVLVVDDDPGVREMTTRMLCAEGREVRTASTLDEARAILDDPRARVDVLLTDVVIGAERGTDLILPYRKARPKLRIVVMSGYTPDPSASEIVTGQGVEFLPKPFGRDQLLRSLQGA
jgi:signal transduction histidine kinase